MVLNLFKHVDLPAAEGILDAVPALIFLEQGADLVFANSAARALLLGDSDKVWKPRPSIEILWGLAEAAGTKACRVTLPCADGKILPVEIQCHGDESADPLRILVATPVAHAPVHQPCLTENLVACLPDAIAIVRQHHILYANPAFGRIFGYSQEECNGANLLTLIVPEARRQEHSAIEREVKKKGILHLETVRSNKKGDWVDVSMLVAPLIIDGVTVGMIYCYRDIAARKQAEARLQHDALHDGLTGLPNRMLFLDRLKLALNRRTRRRDLSCGVLFIDLDRFKEINDTLGHAAGDEVLSTVADRLRGALRPQDTAARFGGDEFAVLVDSITSIEDLDVVASRVLRQLVQPFQIADREVIAGASIGVVMAGPDHTAPELLIRDADYAMYRAKQDGGNRCEIFDKTLRLEVTDLQKKELELRQTLDERTFEIWYEPIFQLQSGRPEGFESCLRWRREDKTLAAFEELLQVAEESGLSVSIGRENIEGICRRLREWEKLIPNCDQTLTVNLTERQFFHPDFLPQLKRVLVMTGVKPAQLLFEVSEKILHENPDQSAGILQCVADYGVRIALDDFGAQMAPLSYLVRMPIHIVKLHRRLVGTVAAGGRQQAVVESLLLLGRKLGIEIVAQGIETQEQFEALRRLGCELGQGSLLSQVLDAQQALELAQRGLWQKAPLS